MILFNGKIIPQFNNGFSMRSGKPRNAMKSHIYGGNYMRSKKSSIAIISALMLFVEFLSNTFKFLKEVGGNEKMAYDYFSSPTGAKEFAELIFSKKTSPSIPSLSTLITFLEFDSVNDNITESNFPILPEDKIAEKKYKLFYFGKSISSKSAIAKMEKENFRPVTIRELLLWALKNWDGKTIVVALGQIWHDSDDDDDCDVSALCSYNGRRILCLDSFDFVWDNSYRFLGVCEQH